MCTSIMAHSPTIRTSWRKRPRSVLNGKTQKQTPRPVVQVYHCYSQSCYNQQFKWSNAYGQEHRWVANGTDGKKTKLWTATRSAPEKPKRDKTLDKTTSKHHLL